jgi:hypothetical protein
LLGLLAALFVLATGLWIVEQVTHGLVSSVARLASLFLFLAGALLLMGRLDRLQAAGRRTTTVRDSGIVLGFSIATAALAIVIAVSVGAQEGFATAILGATAAGLWLAYRRAPSGVSSKVKILVIVGLAVVMLALTFYIATRP